MDGIEGLNSSTINVLVKLLADTKGLAEAETKVSSFQEGVKKAGMFAAGALITAGTAAIAASAYSIKAASDFQSAMTLIQTQAGASAKEVNNMSKAILQLAPAVGSTPKQLADALFYAESAGYSGAKALDILKISAEGAKVGEADLTDTVKAITSILNSHIKGVKDASDAMGQMNAIVGAGKMKMEDLNSALSSGILASAQSFGLSLKDVGAALDTMTNAGVPAEEAATRLRMTFSLIEAPTRKAQDALASIGMTQRQMADDMRKGGLLSALQDLSKHMNEVQPATTVMVKGTKESASQLAKLGENITYATDRLKILNETHAKAGVATDRHNLAVLRATNSLADYQAKVAGANQRVTSFGGGMLDATQKAQLMSDMFGGGRTSSAMLTLVNNLDQVKSRLKQVNDTSNNFGAAWQKTQEDATFANARFAASVQTIAVQYGTMLLPIYTQVVNFLASSMGPTLNALTGWWKEHQAQITAVANVIMTNLIFAFKMIWLAIQSAFIPVLIQLRTLWQQHHQAITLVAEVLAGVLLAAVVGAIIVIGTLIQVVIKIIDAILSFGETVTKIFTAAGETFLRTGNFFMAMGNIILNILAQIGNAFADWINGIINAINTVIRGIDAIGKTKFGGGLNIPLIPTFGNFGVSGLSPSVSSINKTTLNQDIKNGGISITNYNQFNTPGGGQQLLSGINFQLAGIKN